MQGKGIVKTDWLIKSGVNESFTRLTFSQKQARSATGALSHVTDSKGKVGKSPERLISVVLKPNKVIIW